MSTNPMSKGNIVLLSWCLCSFSCLKWVYLLVFFASQRRNPVWYPGSADKSWIRQQESINLSAFSVHHCCFYIQTQNNSLGHCKNGKELKNLCVYVFIFVCKYWWIMYYRFLISSDGCLIHQFSWLRWNTLATNPSLFSKKKYFCQRLK